MTSKLHAKTTALVHFFLFALAVARIELAATVDETQAVIVKEKRDTHLFTSPKRMILTSITTLKAVTEQGMVTEITQEYLSPKTESLQILEATSEIVEPIPSVNEAAMQTIKVGTANVQTPLGVVEKMSGIALSWTDKIKESKVVAKEVTENAMMTVAVKRREPRVERESPNQVATQHSIHERHVGIVDHDVEIAAERHPYVVALLNGTRHYVCSGMVLDEKHVLTVGRCARRWPKFIVLGAAVLSPTNNELVAVDKVLLPPHSANTMPCDDLAVVVAQYPVLEQIVQRAPLAPISSSRDLMGQRVQVVGYGCRSEQDLWALHMLTYRVVKCIGSGWVQCACAVEVDPPAHLPRRAPGSCGWGGPVLHARRVVGVAALPSGALNDKGMVFVLTKHQLPWLVSIGATSVTLLRSEAPAPVRVATCLSVTLLLPLSLVFINCL